MKKSRKRERGRKMITYTNYIYKEIQNKNYMEEECGVYEFSADAYDAALKLVRECGEDEFVEIVEFDEDKFEFISTTIIKDEFDPGVEQPYDESRYI